MVIGPHGHPGDHARSRAVVARRPGPARALILHLSTQAMIVLALQPLQLAATPITVQVRF